MLSPDITRTSERTVRRTGLIARVPLKSEPPSASSRYSYAYVGTSPPSGSIVPELRYVAPRMRYTYGTGLVTVDKSISPRQNGRGGIELLSRAIRWKSAEYPRAPRWGGWSVSGGPAYLGGPPLRRATKRRLPHPATQTEGAEVPTGNLQSAYDVSPVEWRISICRHDPNQVILRGHLPGGGLPWSFGGFVLYGYAAPWRRALRSAASGYRAGYIRHGR